jgi:SPP1 family predicted phage head-tail adaptor
MAASTGAMRELITFESYTTSSDGGGGVTRAWSTATTAYAHVVKANASEAYKQGGIQEQGLWRFTMRYTAGITTEYRISWDSKVFNIRSIINEDERDKFLVILAEEGVAI